MKSMGFIGGGRVTKIILNGLQKGELPLHNVIVTDTNPDTLKELKNEFPAIKIVTGDNGLAASQDMVFLAIHPPAFAAVLSDVKSHLNPSAIVISLAPKPQMEQISTSLDQFPRIVRMIPNAPSIINQGYNPVNFSREISNDEKKDLLKLFSILGTTLEVDEDKLEAYAVLTAMGPTYFWFQFEQLQELGRSFGLEQDEVKEGLLNMVSGAARTFYQSDLTSEEVLDLVPVKPMGEEEDKIKTAYKNRLEAMFKQLKQ